MDELQRDYLIDFYSTQLMIHGDRPEAVRWSARGQRLRFQRITDLLLPDLQGASLLDYGCGKGDLLTFLKEQAIHTRYTGMDITPPLIKLAAEKHPDATFEVNDAEDNSIEADRLFDFVVMCGVFNNRVEGATESLKATTKKLFAHTRRTLLLTALTTHVRDRSHELNYVDPDEMLAFVRREITTAATLFHCPTEDDFYLLLHQGE